MNRYIKHLFYLSLIGLILLPVSLFAAESPNAIGEVIFLKGVVHAEQQGSENRTLELGSEVNQNDRIVTHDRSNVEIRFTDDTIYAQGESSSVFLDDYVYSDIPSQSKLLFKMSKGTFRFVTGEIVKQNPESYKLNTPLATIGIRGTEPFAIVSPKKETIGVIAIDPDHTVEVSTKIASVSIDKPGIMTTVAPDGSLSPPTSTPAPVRQSVINSAPMTSKGELGSVGNINDQKAKIAAFKKHVTNQKEKLSNLDGKPDYGRLHQLNVMQSRQSAAQSEHDTSPSTDPANSGGGTDGSESRDSSSSHDHSSSY